MDAIYGTLAPHNTDKFYMLFPALRGLQKLRKSRLMVLFQKIELHYVFVLLVTLYTIKL